jgi:hypothetical protein
VTKTSGDGVCSAAWLMNAFIRCDRVPTILFTILISFFNRPHPPTSLTLLTLAIQVHPPFKFTSVMFKLRTFLHGGGCLQKQERCCRASDSQINPRRYDPRDEWEQESWTSFRDQHSSDGYATSPNLSPETSTKESHYVITFHIKSITEETTWPFYKSVKLYVLTNYSNLTEYGLLKVRAP